MKIKDHWSLSDSEYEKAFEDCTLKPSMFSHEAHLRLAYIHIRKYGAEQAEKNMCDQILKFATSLNFTDKFNKTVTVAAVKMVNHFIQKSDSDSFKGLIQEFPRLNTSFRELLAQHYGFDIFKNKKAKQEYLEPDLAPIT